MPPLPTSWARENWSSSIDNPYTFTLSGPTSKSRHALLKSIHIHSPSTVLAMSDFKMGRAKKLIIEITTKRNTSTCIRYRNFRILLCSLICVDCKCLLEAFLSRHRSAETQCWMRRYVRTCVRTYVVRRFSQCARASAACMLYTLNRVSNVFIACK